jgi:hypothetical protein
VFWEHLSDFCECRPSVSCHCGRCISGLFGTRWRAD